MAGINLGSGFNRVSNQPLDLYSEAADLTARDAIPSGVRYQGMSVFVIAEGKSYTLIGGIADINWVEGGGGGAGGGLLIWQTPQTVTAGAQLTLGVGVARQGLKLSSATDVTLNANLFASAPTDDGTEIFIVNVGANTIKIPYADINGGVLAVGDIYLSPGQTVTLVRDATADRYYELARRA